MQVVHTYVHVCVGVRGLVVGVDSLLSGYGSILTAGPLQATLSKLLTYCAQVNSASYPQRDGK